MKSPCNGWLLVGSSYPNVKNVVMSSCGHFWHYWMVLSSEMMCRGVSWVLEHIFQQSWHGTLLVHLGLTPKPHFPFICMQFYAVWELLLEFVFVLYRLLMCQKEHCTTSMMFWFKMTMHSMHNTCFQRSMHSTCPWPRIWTLCKDLVHGKDLVQDCLC